MNKIIYPTVLKIAEPLLLDSKSLIELDNIIKECLKSFQGKINQEIIEKIQEFSEKYPDKDSSSYEKELRRSGNRNKNELTIRMKEKIIKCNSFKEAIKDPNTKNELVKSFSYKIREGNYLLEVDLNKYYDSGLEIYLSPPEESVVYENFYKLNGWADTYKSSKWVQIWKKNVSAIWMLLFIYISLSGIYVMQSDNDIYYKKQLNKEASEMIENGIDSTEVNRAIELLLIKNFEMIPNNYKVIEKDKSWWYYSSGILLLLAVGLSFSPKTRIGIGKGEILVRRWKLWIKFISITVPLFILSNILSGIFTRIGFFK